MNRAYPVLAIVLCALVTLVAGWALLVPHPLFQTDDLIVAHKYLNSSPETHLMTVLEYDGAHDRYRIAACSDPDPIGEVKVYYELQMWYERPWLEEDFTRWGRR
ncbi:hypothetical protein [Methanofollis ethanolicus]|uniref:hypothetical protein n=1 Tax=Methanofollis ethanolicus TaxID=488124 RepID=UPI00128F894C|nr:hypothetical protein [Methanofollis ethanolicus]